MVSTQVQADLLSADLKHDQCLAEINYKLNQGGVITSEKDELKQEILTQYPDTKREPGK